VKAGLGVRMAASGCDVCPKVTGRQSSPRGVYLLTADNDGVLA
jgi:hypothetical protein